MKNVKREMKRKGFTLVELLIVIVVIGVLSAMMMLSSTEAVSSAKASDIVSDLRNLKTAALAYYADNLTAAENASFDLSGVKTGIAKYMGNEGVGDYTFTGTGAGHNWFVWITVNDSKVFGKLKARASQVGLWLQGTGTPPTSADLANNTTSTTGTVGLFIR
ncbi:MAG: prepilin-type N-terminal cleavage/methylation domain-containing protein [Synergistaceae bacterium]|nr:prepilin-type N-terminal cleavage/methylation domain-containing protein [Synergistaceae bacterium]